MATVRQALDIMGEFYDRERGNEDWQKWFIANDVAIPLAWMTFHGIANPTDLAVEYVDESWAKFCEVFRMDRHSSFDTLDDFLDFAYSQPDSPETT